MKSVKEFIAYAKERPGKLTFGSTGVGAMDYLAAELFMRQTGIKMVHVPYRGGPLALNDLFGGQIDLLIEVFPVVSEQIRSGAIKGSRSAVRIACRRFRTCRHSRRPAFPASF